MARDNEGFYLKRRDMHWEYFYDDFGVPLIRLYRRLAELRRSRVARREPQVLRSPEARLWPL